MKLSHLCILLGAIFLLGCEPNHSSKVNLYNFVPTSSIALAEINNLPKLIEQKDESHIVSTLHHLPQFTEAQNIIAQFSGVIPEEELASFYKNRKFLVSLNLSGANKFDFLIYTASSPAFERQFSEGLAQKFNASQQAYAGETIYEFKSENVSLFLASVQGVLLISINKNTVEEAIRQHNSSFSLEQDADFLKLQNTSNAKDLVNLFINLKETPPLLNKLLPQANSSILAQAGSWVELDWQSTPQQLIASGLLLNEASNYFTSVFKGINTHAQESAKIVPNGFGLWVNYNIGNVEQYYRQYNEYLQNLGQLSAHHDLLAKLPPKSAQKLNGIIDNEMGYFQSGRTGETANSFAYFKYRVSPEELNKTMQYFSDSSNVEGYRGLIIKRLSSQNLLPRVYGQLFKEFHFPYYTTVNDYVLLANNLAAMKVVLNDILASKTLSNSESYQRLLGQMPGSSHISVIASNPEFLSLVADVAPAAKKELEVYSDSLSLIKWGALQIKATQNGAFTNLVLIHEPPVKEKVIRKWTTNLPAPIMGEPQFLKDHRSGKFVIAVCDENNILYVLNHEGTLLWKYALDQRIIGDIRQIDIYKNNKLQLVFNTARKLYVLDILGRNVEGFPVQLSAEATAPVGVFNYDRARNYRLVVPAGPNLLNYNVQGETVSGWNFKKAESDIVSEPQHFSVDGKDIIVALSAKGKLYQLNRRGEERFVVEQKIEELKTSFYMKEGPSLKESELLAGSNSGKMYVINPQGKVDAIYLDESKPADHLIYFNESYIFSHEDELVVKNEKHPFSAAFEADISVKPKAMILNNRFYVGAFAKGAEEIRVFNQEGQLLDGFPVFAQGPFDMGSLNRDGKMNIVTYSSDGTLICYLLR